MVGLVRPAGREDFHIAIICALAREFDAVSHLLDHIWEDDDNLGGRAAGDNNTYTNGRIGKHNVVLVVLPEMGTNSAASATAGLRSSYTRIKLALLVGICGGVPRIDDWDAMLGDVVISRTIVQYDYGRQYPGNFAVKNDIEDSLGRANKEIRGLLASFETEMVREQLQTKAAMHLKRLQDPARRKRGRAKYGYPGAAEDKLFRSDYTHVHRNSCDICDKGDFCQSASKASCSDIGCDKTHLVERERRVDEANYIPEIFIGRVGSGNTVMKSGKHRDDFAREHDIIAFEMEGAGAWDELPCLVVKGICDYADSHKNKKWQDFAAATAASVARAISERYTANDDLRNGIQGKNDQGQGNGHRSISNNRFGKNAQITQGDVYHWSR